MGDIDSDIVYLDETDDEIYIVDKDESSIGKEYSTAFEKYHKLYNAGIEKFNGAWKTCFKVIREVKNDAKLKAKEFQHQYEASEEVKKASETSNEAKRTMKHASKIYEKAKQIYDKNQKTIDRHTVFNGQMDEAANNPFQLSDADSAYDSNNDSDKDSDEDETLPVDVKKLTPIEYEENLGEDQDNIGNAHADENYSHDSWKLD